MQVVRSSSFNSIDRAPGADAAPREGKGAHGRADARTDEGRGLVVTAGASLRPPSPAGVSLGDIPQARGSKRRIPRGTEFLTTGADGSMVLMRVVNSTQKGVYAVPVNEDAPPPMDKKEDSRWARHYWFRNAEVAPIKPGARGVTLQTHGKTAGIASSERSLEGSDRKDGDDWRTSPKPARIVKDEVVFTMGARWPGLQLSVEGYEGGRLIDDSAWFKIFAGRKEVIKAFIADMKDTGNLVERGIKNELKLSMKFFGYPS